MAQVPWTVISRQPIEASAAARHMRVCYRSIRKACAAAEGAPTANALLQHEALRSLKGAHAALKELLYEEQEEKQQEEAAADKNNCFELVTVR